MKNTLTLMVGCTLLATTALAQTAKLQDLDRFDKIVIKGDVSGIDISSSDHDQLSIFVEGASNDNVRSSLEAGTLYLDVLKGDKAVVHVFNGGLRRIEGPEDLRITGAEVIGDNGKYLITDFKGRSRHWLGNHVDCDFDFDLDIDLDELEDMDVSVHIDIDDHDWDWNWNWDWNWEDHRNEFRNHSKHIKEDLKESLNEIKEDLKDDLKELKRDLKRL